MNEPLSKEPIPGMIAHCNMEGSDGCCGIFHYSATGTKAVCNECGVVALWSTIIDTIFGLLEKGRPTEKSIEIVFAGSPGPTASRFVETEIDGKGVKCGQWARRPDGYWLLRISVDDIEKANAPFNIQPLQICDGYGKGGCPDDCTAILAHRKTEQCAEHYCPYIGKTVRCVPVVDTSAM